MSFTKYAGTAFAPWLFPIIPVDAPLTSGSTIPEKSKGKTPGFRTDNGEWYGHADWTKQVGTDDPERQRKIFRKWDDWYPDSQPIIGINARLFPAIDIDIDNLFAETAKDIAFEMLGPTIIRGRPNSQKMLLMYRLQQPGYFITKQRRVYCDPDGYEFAVEILGKGQQYLIEGHHPSGVDYVWAGGRTPLMVGTDELPEITPDKVFLFIRRLDEVFGFGGIMPVRPKGLNLSGSSGRGEETPVGLDHRDRAPSTEMVIDALSYLSVNDPEFESRADWEVFLRALKTAAGGDEGFYAEHYLPWNLQHADNEETDIRPLWGSHRTSGVGWSLVASLAGAKGYMGEVQRCFDNLDETESEVGGSNDADIKGGLADPGAAQDGRPRAPRSPDSELVIADKFVREHARKDWIFVPTSRTGGTWYHFEGGTWANGYNQALVAVAEECAAIGDMIRTRASATQAQLTLARNLTGAHAAENVLRLVRAHKDITVPRGELDNHKLLMGVPAGYVDLKGVLVPPKPELLITKSAGVAPVRSADCPRWEEMVWHLSNGDGDTFLSLRSALGYTVSGTGQEQKFFFLHGRKGHEGKTSFLSCLAMVMGDYATLLPDNAFVMSHGSDIRFAFGGLEGAWFAYTNEIEEGQEWAANRLKDKTGSGMTMIERKGVDAIEIPIRYGLWFQGNHLPRFRKPDTALRRRMVIFECRTRVPEGQTDLNWAETVFKEEGPGIMDWLMQARIDYMKHGLYLPPAMITARDDYLNSQDALRLFLDQCVEFDPEASIPSRELFEQWRLWRELEGHRVEWGGTLETFSKAVLNHELCEGRVSSRFRGSKRRRHHVLVGMRLADGSEDDEAGEGGADTPATPIWPAATL